MEADDRRGGATAVLTRPHVVPGFPLVDPDQLRSLFDLTGRVAIVTGGTRGIGRSIAEGFVASGARVAVASRKADACDDTEEALRAMGGDAIGVPTHLGELDSLHALVERTVDEFGRLDIVVNNAATPLREDLGHFTPEAYAKSMDVNLRGPVFLVQEALPHLQNSPIRRGHQRDLGGSVPARTVPGDVRGDEGGTDVVHPLDGGGVRSARHPRRTRSRPARSTPR